MSGQDDDHPVAAVAWLLGSPVGGYVMGEWFFPDEEATCRLDPDCLQTFNTTAGLIGTGFGWALGAADHAYESGDNDWYV